MIYVISNVEYPIERRIYPTDNDILVFLNKAKSISYYSDFKNKIVFHRSPKDSYGDTVAGIENYYCFDGPKDKTISKDFVKLLKKEYDWDYEIEEGKAKCATTGYMVVKYLESKYGLDNIILVNFGYGVKKSSYRCPWHNWKFEDSQLSKFKHIFTADIVNHSEMEIAYACNAKYLYLADMSAKTVLKYNPNAHITILSDEKLDTVYDNVVVKFNYNLKYDPRRFTKIAYFRFLLPEYLKYKKVLYLDSDTICHGSLEELWNMVIEYMAASHGHNVSYNTALTKIGNPDYIQSGVLLMNLDNLRRINFTKNIMYVAEHFDFPDDKLPFCDETILNYCFYENVRLVSHKWNYVMGRNYSKYPEKLKQQDAAIWHFTSGRKDLQKKFFEKEMTSKYNHV